MPLKLYPSAFWNVPLSSRTTRVALRAYLCFETSCSFPVVSSTVFRWVRQCYLSDLPSPTLPPESVCAFQTASHTKNCTFLTRHSKSSIQSSALSNAIFSRPAFLYCLFDTELCSPSPPLSLPTVLLLTTALSTCSLWLHCHPFTRAHAQISICSAYFTVI